MPVVKLAINHWPGYEFLFLAKEKHYFEKEGVRVQLVEFTSLPDVLEAYQSGDVDGMACTLVETLAAAGQARRQPQIFLVTDYSNGGDVILARNEIRIPDGLSGLAVACESNHLGGYMLYRALQKYNRTLADVKLVNLDQTEMEKAFRKGEVDAVVAYPPVSTSLLRDGQAQVIFSSANIPGEVLDVLVADKSLIDGKPDAVRAIIRAWGRAHKFHTRNREDSHQIMGRHMGLMPEEFAQILDKLKLIAPDEQVPYFEPENGRLLEIARNTHGILRQMGSLSGDLDISVLIAPASLHPTP
ncbi:ABC transporter substrate-binding protein [Ruficoccus amylovorans]|uniref:ABC transporter substrate-binding protein n=1 Tax=Ruficoccus amylovorans TaxID=1804625 RepID=A0A842HF13_9BACT|nr:ABC transporter substrate-binding protein [Ruficoccus amylovorans]MBC2594114.1 ABC transporter substrate-binding protein [Ruficoccus amylovorans]